MKPRRSFAVLVAAMIAGPFTAPVFAQNCVDTNIPDPDNPYAIGGSPCPAPQFKISFVVRPSIIEPVYEGLCCGPWTNAVIFARFNMDGCYPCGDDCLDPPAPWEECPAESKFQIAGCCGSFQDVRIGADQDETERFLGAWGCVAKYVGQCFDQWGGFHCALGIGATEKGKHLGGSLKVKGRHYSAPWVIGEHDPEYCEDPWVTAGKEILKKTTRTVRIKQCKDGGGAGALPTLGALPGTSSCCEALPMLSIGNLSFQPGSGTESVRGIAVRNLSVRGPSANDYWRVASVKLPGVVPLTTAASIPGFSFDWTDSGGPGNWTTFKLKVTTSEGLEYRFEKNDSSAASGSDWDGRGIPAVEVKNGAGEVIQKYSSEDVAGTNGMSRVLKQYATTENTAPWIEYHYTTNGITSNGPPVQLAYVETSSGRRMDVEYDEHDRLVYYSLGGSSQCSGCDAGQRLYYRVYDPEQDDEYNETIIRRSTLDDPEVVIADYQYDDEDRLIQLARGAAAGSDPDLVIIQSVDYTTNGPDSNGIKESIITTRNYVDTSSYELVEVVESPPGQVVSESVWTGLNGTGQKCTTIYCGMNTNGWEISTTQFPEGNYEVRRLDPWTGTVRERFRATSPTASGSPDWAMRELFQYYESQGNAQVFMATNAHGGRTLYCYDSYWFQQDLNCDPGSWPIYYSTYSDTGLILGRFEDWETATSFPQVGGLNVYYDYDFERRLLVGERKEIASDVFVTTIYDYNSNGNTLREQVEDVGGLELTTAYEYTSHNEISKITDPRGVERYMEYDDAGHVIREYTLDTVAGGSGLVVQETRYEYDGGRLRYVKEADVTEPYADSGDPAQWMVTEYQYDLWGRRTKMIVDPEGENLATTYEYDLQDRVIKTTTPGGVWTKTELDGRGLQIAEVVGHGSTEVLRTSYEYDLNGNLTKVIEPSGRTTTYAYDEFDRRTTMTRD